MNFSEKNEAGISLWFLVWNKTKTVTRRTAPCLRCGKKWWEHTRTDRGVMCLPDTLKKRELELAGGIRFYEPDLSRWQPKDVEIEIENLTDGELDAKEDRTIAICPSRGKAAICKNCGCWKEHHLPQIGGHGVAYGFWVDDHVPICCDNYAPLRKRIVGCELESEWQTKMKQFAHDKPDRNFNILPLATLLNAEARREGFATWEGLQDALYGKGGYPKPRSCCIGDSN